MSDNNISLGGIFSEGYGIIPKKLMRLKLNHKVGKQKGKNVKLVLAYMLSFTGQGNNMCFPSIKTIASDLEISRDTVIEAINNACNLGMITKSKMYPDNPLKHNNKYTMDFLMKDPNIKSSESLFRGSDGSTYRVQTFEQNNNINNNNNINSNEEYKASKKKEQLKPYIPLASLLYSLHKKIDEGYMCKYSKPQIEKIIAKWANDIRLMVERDKRNPKGIEAVIRWIKQPGSFWAANIKSGFKLRKQYDTLVAQYKYERAKNGHLVGEKLQEKEIKCSRCGSKIDQSRYCSKCESYV